MRVAWFSPLPPARSGVAAYSADLVPRLRDTFAIDCFPESRAHDFVWRHRRASYDLTVYHLGNAPFHDYMWAYLAAYPGLVVLHDACLHHARARQLLSQNRFDDYRHELWFDHPDVIRDFAEYAVEGLSGPIYYLWPMLRVVMQTAKLVAVHHQRVAADLCAAFPEAPVRSVPHGRATLETPAPVRQRTRAALDLPDDAVVFAVFGKLTAEKRIGPILRAFADTPRDDVNARLLFVGDAAEYPTLHASIAELAIADRVRVIGHVPDDMLGGYLAAADVCLCLRWPTARESSAAWLDCLAAGRATVITDLAHLADVPTIDLREQPSAPSTRVSPHPVAVRIDLLDEDAALRLAMRRLASDGSLRAALARAGHDYWAANHTIELAAARYRDLIREAAARPAPVPEHLPPHFTDDYTGPAYRIADRFGVLKALSFLR